MSDSVEIACDELKEYVSSSKSVTFTIGGCKMPGKKGRVEFDFSEFNPDQVFVHLKRAGGNGKLIISGAEFVVGSRTYQTFDICTSGKVELSRPKNSTGDVVLLGFTFLADKVSEKVVGTNWKDTISRCGKYKCLRLVKDRLFASTGAYIEKGFLVQTIETNPPNAMVRDGDKIRFNSSCEIIDIVLGNGAPTNGRPAELFVNRRPPTPINVPQPKAAPDKMQQPGGNAAMRPQQYKHQLPNFDDHILYDSLALHNFKHFVSTRNKGVKQIHSNKSTYLVVKQNGRARAAMSALIANTDYICIINGKRLNGNGRLYIGASIDDNFAGEASETVFGGNFTNRYIQIRTGGGAPNALQKLHLSMPGQYCHGEILIQRIMIIRDLGLDNARIGLEGRKYLPVSEVRRPENPETSFSFNVDIHRRDDPVYVAAKKYAFYPHIKEAQHLKSNVKGTIISNNVSGIVWASRIGSVIKNIRIGDLKSETANDSLLISHIGHLKPANNIWIEPFDFGAEINEQDRMAINRAHKVMSPSLSNVQYLQSKFEDKKIELAYRPLPWMHPTTEQMFQQLDFVLVFERNKVGMKQITSVWEPSMPKLVVVGARGRYPDFVIPLNEYYPYKNLLYLIKKARFIIDLPGNCDYHSSLLDLANSMGKTIVSTNWYMLDKANGIFLTRNENKDGSLRPSDDVLKHGINQALSIHSKINDMSSHNDKFLAQVELLFSS